MSRLVRVGAGIILIAALASCSLFDYSGVVPKKYALVYGVTNYISTSDPNWHSYNDPNLTYPDADAQDVAAMLRQKGYAVLLRYVDGMGMEWLATPSSTIPQNVGDIATDPSGTNGPSRANITQDLTSYFAGVIGPDDLFLFYFSGHGMQDGYTTPTREYIIPLGGVVWVPGAGKFEGEPSLSVRDDELGSSLMLGMLQTPRKVVILDTCNSGGFIGNRLETDITPAAYKGAVPQVTPLTIQQALINYASFQMSRTGIGPSTAQVISAAGSDESSYETAAPFNHGIMTYYLLETPTKADLNGDKTVTVLEAFSFMKAGIETGWNLDPSVAALGETFSPHVSGGPVDFALF
jgi:hypothetical protein